MSEDEDNIVSLSEEKNKSVKSEIPLKFGPLGPGPGGEDEPRGVIRVIINAIVGRARELRADYHDQTLGIGTDCIRRLCDLLEEADEHRDLRIRLRDIDMALVEKLKGIDPGMVDFNFDYISAQQDEEES